MTIDDELAAILERRGKITPGPYTCERQDSDDGSFYFAIHGYLYEFIVNVDEGSNLGRAKANADFITHAPTDIDYLTAALADARKRVGELEAKLSDAHETIAWFKEGKRPSFALSKETE